MATELLDRPRGSAPDVTAPPTPAGGRTLIALSVWVGLIAVAHFWGDHLIRTGHRMKVYLPPIVAWIDARLGWHAVPVLLVAVAGVVWAPRLAARLTWRRLLVVVALTAGVWAAALAFVDGTEGFTKPMEYRSEYIHDVDAVGSPAHFLSTFTDRLPGYHIHTRAHPPGMVLILWALDRAGLGGPGWAAAFVIITGALAAPAALVTLRAVAGESRARTAAPFLALAPAAVWMATTPDGFYAAVGAVGIALVAVGAHRRSGDFFAAAGGVCLGAALYLSYGAVLLVPLVLAVALWPRRIRPLVVAAAGAAVVVAVFTAAGFWWLEGLSATQRTYWDGVASQRPYSYFLVANLAAFALVVGPAAAVALARLRDRATWLLAGAGLAAIAIADLSALSKAEVERIWLPFAPFVLLATVALARRDGQASRGWLGVQVATALALQLGLRTAW